MKKNVAIAMGGYSSEYKISLNSGELVYNYLDRELYNLYRVHILSEGWFVVTDNNEKFPIDKNDFSVNIQDKKITFDVVFNSIHGTPGEDGIFQAYLNILGIPQTSSAFYPAALTFNKRDCISILRAYGIQTAPNYLLNEGDDINTKAIIEKVGLPCFVKANKAGSSFGISKVYKKEELEKAIHFSYKEDDEVIIESFLDGTEVSVGVMNYQNEITALPVTEIISDNDFFDYKAKYLGESQEITPANISGENRIKVQKQAVKIFKILKLNGFARAEFIFHHNEPHFLEINTCPGLSEASIIPQQVKAAGISLKAFFTEMVRTALQS
ncbi:MAG: D-alanine--D-alanine ligase [Mesonia hippocampi]|uniref:D-alanine--D-alanine ligase n=1 Tax=Mesonia hippocampi TaxID=1628250 RepID=UPI003F9BE82A